MSNFSKFSLCLILTLSIVLMRTPIFVFSAEATSFPLTIVSSGVAPTWVSDGVYPLNLSYSAVNPDTGVSLNLMDVTRVGISNSNLTLQQYIDSLLSVYNSFSVISYGTVVCHGGFEIFNYSSSPITFDLTWTIDDLVFNYSTSGSNYSLDHDYVRQHINSYALFNVRQKVVVPAGSSKTIYPLLANGIFMGVDDFAHDGNFPGYAYFFFNIILTFYLQCSFQITSTAPPGSRDAYRINVIYSGYPDNDRIDNSSGYFLFPVRPNNVPDFRIIDALRNIWSAINGSSSMGNLDQTIRQQVQQQTDSLENGYNTDSGDGANGILSSAINSLDSAESFSGEYMDNLNSFTGFDFQESEDTLQAMKVLSDSATSLMDSVSLVRALVVGGITFFIVAVIIGVRRYI